MTLPCPDCGGTGALCIPTTDPQRAVWQHCAACRPDLLTQGEWRVNPYWFAPLHPAVRPDLAPLNEGAIIYRGGPRGIRRRNDN